MCGEWWSKRIVKVDRSEGGREKRRLLGIVELGFEVTGTGLNCGCREGIWQNQKRSEPFFF